MIALSRRDMLRAGGAIVVSFSLVRQTRGHGQNLPGDLKDAPFLDSWLRIGSDGRVTVFTGKAELGQGIKTAIIQVAAEELDLLPDRIAIVTADTAQTPDEGFTAGSHSMQGSATAVMNAAAQARALLIAEAARQWNLRPASLSARDGVVAAP
ncbi:MAG TPA: molybdopterin cofactor-binding domain-containing protein, partial [Rhizomicrobium sp.]|nr:molybdopterin cofactor-binding domain-containing protein [Rhizomicrobium sp.]